MSLNAVMNPKEADGTVNSRDPDQTSFRARGYKTLSTLNSADNEMSNAHKNENIEKFSIFQAHISLECYFSCS